MGILSHREQAKGAERVLHQDKHRQNATRPMRARGRGRPAEAARVAAQTAQAAAQNAAQNRGARTQPAPLVPPPWPPRPRPRRAASGVSSGVQQGVYSARRWTAPKLELAADHVTKTVAPSVSSALRSTAKQVKPAEPKGRTALTWSLLGAAILATAGAAFALLRYQFRAATPDDAVEVGKTTDVSASPAPATSRRARDCRRARPGRARAGRAGRATRRRERVGRQDGAEQDGRRPRQDRDRQDRPTAARDNHRYVSEWARYFERLVNSGTHVVA